MKHVFRSAILNLFLLILLPHAVLSGSVPPRRAQASPVPPEQLAHAKSVFKEKCARCHSANGDGATVLGDMLGTPDFTDSKWWTKETTDTRLIHSVTHGKKEMPAFGKKLTPREIASLVAYVHL